MTRLARGLAIGATLALSAGALAATKPVAKSDTFAGTPKKAPVIIAPPPPEVIVESVRAEAEAYARRLDACTRLRQIAIETSDDKLLQTVDDLERQAAAMYQARVARMGVSTKEPPKASPQTETKLAGAIDPLKVSPPTPVRGLR